jgi:acetolactate synthase-1/2/3 large subunit
VFYQALWTQQREQLKVITVICANQSYNILKIEQTKQKLPTVGKAAAALTNLGQPGLDWVQLAQGHGVPFPVTNPCHEPIKGV